NNEPFSGTGRRQLQSAVKVIDVQMWEYHPSGVRQADTIHEARMIGGVGKNHIVRFEDRTEQSDIRGIPRREVQRSFGANKHRKCGLELFPAFMISGEQS